MGHPFNATQRIELRNLSAQRFVGTDIQKNILYGRDIPVLRFGWTGSSQTIYADVGKIHYDLLTSGDYVKLYTDQQYLNATGKYILEGAVFDLPPLAAVHSGLERNVPFDRPLLGYITSGHHEPSMLDIAYNGHEYLESHVIDIPYDRPLLVPHCPTKGSMLGLTQDREEAGFYFLTGVVFPGDHLPTQADIPDVYEDGYTMSYYFHTGTYDGPSS